MTTTKTKNPLGRGLSALITESRQELGKSEEFSTAVYSGAGTEQTIIEGGLRVTVLPLQSLTPGRFQPRGYFDEEKLRELTESIKENGVLQPILVRSDVNAGQYQIIAGERRWRASKQAGLETIPVVIKEFSDEEALEVALIENIQRQSLTPIEEAEGYNTLQEQFGYSQEELAKGLGKSRSHIANMMRLLQLPEKVKDLINTGEITMGHARALIRAENPVELAYMVIQKGLSVRETEKFAAGSGKLGGGANARPVEIRQRPASPARPEPRVINSQKDEDLLAIERSLTESTGLKVLIEDGEQGGTVTLFFNNLAELDAILQRLG